MTELNQEVTRQTKTTGSPPLDDPSNAYGISAPITPNAGWLSQIKDLNKHIFDDFYNVFRFIGYIAETFHSEIKDKLKGKKIFGISLEDTQNQRLKDSLLAPDIVKSKSRFVVNAIEAATFEAAAIWALFRDRNKFRHDISNVIAAETGQPKPHLTIEDTLHSENPLIQSATNRLKSLYTLRLLQPLTFLWGLKLGVVSTVLEIISERTAYMEKNSYDRLQKLCKDINSNQYGGWSRTSIVEQMISIMQQNRLEHHSSPINTQDIEHYMPLLQNVADRMSDKQWGLGETLFILGQIIKEPAAIDKAHQAYNDVINYSLQGIADKNNTPTSPEVMYPGEEEHPSQAPAFVRNIVERGPKNTALTSRNAVIDGVNAPAQIVG